MAGHVSYLNLVCRKLTLSAHSTHTLCHPSLSKSQQDQIRKRPSSLGDKRLAKSLAPSTWTSAPPVSETAGVTEPLMTTKTLARFDAGSEVCPMQIYSKTECITATTLTNWPNVDNKRPPGPMSTTSLLLAQCRQRASSITSLASFMVSHPLSCLPSLSPDAHACLFPSPPSASHAEPQIPHPLPHLTREPSSSLTGTSMLNNACVCLSPCHVLPIQGEWQI